MSIVIEVSSPKKDLNLKNEDEFLRFVKAIFNQRRKTMVNNISSYYKISKAEIEEKLKDININISIRSEALSLEEIAFVYKHLFEEV